PERACRRSAGGGGRAGLPALDGRRDGAALGGRGARRLVRAHPGPRPGAHGAGAARGLGLCASRRGRGNRRRRPRAVADRVRRRRGALAARAPDAGRRDRRSRHVVGGRRDDRPRRCDAGRGRLGAPSLHGCGRGGHVADRHADTPAGPGRRRGQRRGSPPLPGALRRPVRPVRGAGVRVVHLTAFGGPEVLQPAEVPDPEPRPGHVAVDLVRAALNHREVWIREGRPGPLPAVLGSDGAGVVSEVGAGVEGVSIGDEVVINPSLDWGEREDAPGPDFRILGVPDQGTYAERIVIAAHQVRPRPSGWSWDECAAFPLAGLTAWRALRLAGAGPGRRILVTGAGGGVATFLVQIGAALGATIVATSGSDPKVARALELGAAQAVDYHDPEWPRRIGPVHAAIDSTGGSGLDAVIGTL